jgi:hypothetical protein
MEKVSQNIDAKLKLSMRIVSSKRGSLASKTLPLRKATPEGNPINKILSLKSLK